MKRKMFSAVSLLTIILAAGCATGKKAAPTVRFKPMTLSEKGITVSLVHLTEGEILTRFGRTNNPFLPDRSLTGGGPSIVFELTVETGSDIRIYLKSIEFHAGDRFRRPINGFHLGQYWDTKIQRSDRYRGWSSGVVQKKIKDNMFPDRLKLAEGKNHTGLIVFSGSVPLHGEVTLYVPVYSPHDELIHTFEF